MKTIRCLRITLKLIKELPRSLALVPLCAGITALLISTPIWPARVRLDPQNPMIIVDLKTFGTSLASLLGRGLIASNTLAQLNSAFRLNFTNDQSKLTFNRELYYRENAPNYPKLNRIMGSRDSEVEDFNIAGALKQRKDWLGIDDADTRRTDLGRMSSR